MNKPIEFQNITDELHFSSLMDELEGQTLTKSELAAAFIAGQIALIQRMKKETHGMYNGEKLIGVVDTADLEQYLVEKTNEYKATAGDQQPVGPAAVRTDK